MSLESLPEKVRNSELAKALETKIPSAISQDFDYWSNFSELRKTVSAQVGQMNVLFPQFTPHDEEKHLARLFGIADDLLGMERYQGMNAPELFLLACGLYAHDWGMAVGPKELKFLRSGAKEKPKDDEFFPLENESQRLKEFVKKNGLMGPEQEDWPELTPEHLKIYIRHTHAWRSGARANAFFKKAGASVPQAIDRICQGHWLDFSQLEDEQRFSTQMGVLGQTVNLRAIAVYVRLIDLFDIADDRTPYAVWKFVAPDDRISKMEWEKHRALSPVTFPKYGVDGRAVRFDGATSDPEVWAELTDLRNYCQAQLEGSLDLLSRHSDSRHTLDIRKLEWLVVPENFEPIDIRFEFDRDRMFEILADEIYRGDSHVFLRELLQNSIDAIRMRKEIVDQTAERSNTRNMGYGFDDAIYFDVKHHENGDCTVSCSDSGVGMDEYTVRNYLALAGRSYYQSDDFKNEGLKMDPISRFGVGILSCFMVADQIDIETYREPKLSVTQKPLRIEIPNRSQQFRVYPGDSQATVGTKVTVNVQGKKLKADITESNENSVKNPGRLQVTRYLSEIAGFVNFPIVIDENDERSVILHPDRAPEDAEDFKPSEDKTVRVFQLNFEYPWEEVFYPQDLELAKEWLGNHIIDFNKDLNLESLQGSITFVSPLDYDVHVDSIPHKGLEIHKIKTPDTKARIRHRQTVASTPDNSLLSKKGIAPSSEKSDVLKVYRNGILVPEAEIELGLEWGNPFPFPSITLNLCENGACTLDLSRRAIGSSGHNFRGNIYNALVKLLADSFFNPTFELSVEKQFWQIGLLKNAYHLEDQDLEKIVPAEKAIFVGLGSSRKKEFLQNPLVDSELIIAPSILKYLFMRFFLEKEAEDELDPIFIQNWSNDKSCYLIDNVFASKYVSNNLHLIKPYVSSWEMSFLNPPLPGMAPLPQTKLTLNPTPIIEENVISWNKYLLGIASDPAFIHKHSSHPFKRFMDFHSIQQTLRIDFCFLDTIPFNHPYESMFGVILPHRDLKLNELHPMVKATRTVAATLYFAHQKNIIDSKQLGELQDKLVSIVSGIFSNEYAKGIENYNSGIADIWKLLKGKGLLDSECPPSIDASEIIGLSESNIYWWYALNARHRLKGVYPLIEKHIRPYGQELEEALVETVPEDVKQFVHTLGYTEVKASGLGNNSF